MDTRDKPGYDKTGALILGVEAFLERLYGPPNRREWPLITIRKPAQRV
jgi:hypothetical protein